MRSNLTIIGCGGGGIKTAIKCYEELNTLGDEYSTCNIECLDTTTKTIHAFPEYDKHFEKVVTNRISNSEIDGAAGEKKDIGLVRDTLTYLKKYLDNKKFSNNRNDYYVVMFAAGGASGSTIGSLLTKLLLASNYNVLVATPGDSSSLLNLNNTITSISSLQKVALESKRCLSVIYYNNTINKNTTTHSEDEVNDKIVTMLSTFSLLVSGSLTGIDNQDMINFIDPSKYLTFNVKPGIYTLGIAAQEVKDENTLLVRTILSNSKADDNSLSKLKDDSTRNKDKKPNTLVTKIDVPILHNKVSDLPETLKDTYETYPVYMLLRKGILQKEVKVLKDELKELEDLTTTEYDEFDDLDNSSFDEELGIVL